MSSMNVGGYVSRGYEGVRDSFAAAQSEDPGGGQLCVYRHGQKVVDIWGGRDKINDRPYDEDTLTIIMSCSKGATAAVVHQLAERGLIDYEARVTDYWPEFAAGGKQDARVWHLMSHSVGLPGIDPATGLTANDMLVLEKHLPALEAMEPVWTPGASCHYHPITFGSLLDGLVRKVTGKSVSQLLASEISAPLGLDFWIGLPIEQDKRVAPHFSLGEALTVEQVTFLLTGLGIDMSTRLAKVFVASMQQTAELIESMNNTAGRAIQLPAGNGVTNAASLAKMYAAMIGEVDGVRLLKPETVDAARTLRTGAMSPAGDLGKLAALGLPVQYGLGYQLANGPEDRMGLGSFGHDGAGGRIAFAHPESGIAAAYVANTMSSAMGVPDPRWGWIAELRKAVAA
jgi:CubicO group peptidase (beta-lactamase class C family)